MHAENLKRTVYRFIRYHPIVEFLMTKLRATNVADFSSAGVTIKVQKSDIVIDCGANVGDITSRIARTGATIYSLEPNPLCYSMIRRRFSMLSNVQCINKGAMDRAQTLELKTPRATKDFDRITSTASASFVNPFGGAKTDSLETHLVECIDLCAWIENTTDHVRILKMDIEGAEVAILNKLIDNGTTEKIDHILVETHERFSPALAAETAALRKRIEDLGLKDKINLDWH